MFRKVLSIFLAAVFLSGFVLTIVLPADENVIDIQGDSSAGVADSENFPGPEQQDYTVDPITAGGDDPPGSPRGRNNPDYRFVPDEVLAPADSPEHAEQIASAYGLELKSYAYGIAVLLTTDPESEVARSASMSLKDIPELSLNYKYDLFEFSFSYGETELAGRSSSVADDGRRGHNDYRSSRDRLSFDEREKPDYRQRDWSAQSGREWSAQSEPEDDDDPWMGPGQWHRAEMDIDRAHTIASGAGVTVAVIDTGIDLDHPAFTGRILESSYNSHTNEIGLQYVQDDNLHGTHVSGIIAGARDIPNDAAGVAPGAKIMTIKANDPGFTNSFWGDSLLRGINYAVEKGAKIINMSLGRPFEGGYDELEHDTIINAVNNGVLLVCAAGNALDSNAGYPAAYPEAVAVSATQQGYRFDSSYSNYGPQIEISAPGTDIYSAAVGGTYMYMSGTSMAAPNVAGVAALVLEKNPGFTVEQLRGALAETARDVGELGWDRYYGHGIANAYAAALGVNALHSVTFDFSDGVRDPVTVRVVPGDKLFALSDPARSGYAFEGWFLTGTNTEFNFNMPVSGDVSLYAKWVTAEAGMYVLEFPDAGFRREVLRMLNETDGGNRKESSYVAGDLTVLSSLDYLYVSGMGISDMTGLKHLSGLTILHCAFNELTLLDVSGNKALVELICARNNLTSLDVSGNKALENLNLFANDLSSLDVSGNTALTYLDCGENELTVLNISGATALRELFCDVNRLTTLDLLNKTKLEILICAGNLLTQLNVTQNKTLVVLDCGLNGLTSLDVSENKLLVVLQSALNGLTSLDVSENTLLEVLDLYRNNLASLRMSDNPVLRVLDCGENALTALDISGSTALVELWCDLNRLTSLNLLNNNALEFIYCLGNLLTQLDVTGNAQLFFLDCSINFMESIDKVIGHKSIPGLILNETFYFYPQVPGAVPTGVDITASFTDPGFLAAIRDITGKLGEDEPILDYDVLFYSWLEISEYSTEHVIKDLSGIEHFRVLQLLNVSGQQLTSLALSGNPMLEGISAWGNRIESLDVSVNPALMELGIGYNRLETLDVSGNPALRWLYAQGNELKTVALHPTASYEYIDVKWNDMDKNDPDVSVTGRAPGHGINWAPIWEDGPFQYFPQGGNSHGQSRVTFEDWNGTVIEERLLNETGVTIEPPDFYPTREDFDFIGWKHLYTRAETGPDDLITIPDYYNSIYVAMYAPKNDRALVEAYESREFWQAIRQELGRDWDDTGPIYLSEVVNITYLYLSNRNISDMTGIENFTSLRSLYCDSNNISKLDMSASPALLDLSCAYNRITDLNVTDNPKLIHLYCNGNRLTALDLSCNPGLIVLYCNTNRLTGLDVSMNTGLWTLWCQRNLMGPDYEASVKGLSGLSNWNSEFDFIYLPQNEWPVPDDPVSFECANFEEAIREIIGKQSTEEILKSDIFDIAYLGVHDKGITSLAGIEHFPALEILDASYNALEAIDVSGNTALFELDVGYNQLKTLDVSSNTAIKYLHVSGNELETLDVGACPALGLLGVSNTRLTALDLSNNPELFNLNVSSTWLTALDLSKNPELWYLNASETHLETLDLSKNPRLQNLSVGGIYDWDNNQIIGRTLSTLDLSNNQELEYLYVSYTQLNTLNVGNCPELILLAVSYTPLTELDLSKNPELWYLNVSYTHLETLDLSGNPELSELIAQYNHLQSIDLSGNLMLGYADVRYNLMPGPGAITGRPDINWDEEIDGYWIPFAFSPQNIAPTYGISLSRSGTHTFTARAFDYAAQTPLSVTVTNTGDVATGGLTVALSGANADSFTLSTGSLASIVVGGTRSFSVVPNTGLAGGTYTAKVTVSGIGTIETDDGILEKPFSASFDVTFTVNRGAGATLTANPTMSAVTYNSITVNAAAISGTNPGGQTVEYAITTSTSTTMPANLVWGAGTTFSGLPASTAHYVWARTAQNENCNAGAARRSAAITTSVGTFAIALDKSGTFIFPEAAYGYGAQAAETVTVINTGNQPTGALTVALTGTQASRFTLSRTSIPSIALDGEATFTVVPKTGLAVGTHTATVTVSRATANKNNLPAQSFTVRFVVTRADGAAVSAGPLVSGTPAFNSITVAAVAIPANPGKQAAEYAITASNSTTMPVDLKWQSGRTFSGLTHFTEYYVWARTAQNTTHFAGEAQRSAAIKTALGDFGIGLNRLGIHSFGAAAVGYGTRGTVSVTVTNIGNQATGSLTVKLSGDDAGAFELVTPASLLQDPYTFAGIAVGKTGNFTLKPVNGLSVGTYRATVTVSGTNEHFGDFSATFDVAFTVNMAAGAAVSGVPKMQSRTHNSITVSAVTIPTNPGGQAVEYAISRTTTAPTSGWQSGVKFDNLLPSTGYYIYARTAATGNYNAGAVQRSAIINTLAPTHAISLNRSGTRTLSAANFGYNTAAATQRAETVTVKNTGTSPTGALTVELSGKDAGSFVLTPASLSSITVGNSRSFTVKPGVGLLAGTYTATVTVSSAIVPAQSYNVTFTVNRGAGSALKAAPTVAGRTPDSITMNVPGISGANLGEQIVQYAITTSTSSTMPTNLAWQNGPEFTELRPTTAYRVWARTAVNNNCNAGAALRSAEITTLTANHSVELSNGKTILTRTGLHTFNAANYNYATQQTLTVTVRNNGSKVPQELTGPMTVKLTGPDANSFDLSTAELESLTGTATHTFTVVPKHGLASGMYTATVEVRSNDGLLGSFDIRFTVNKVAGAAINAAPKVASRTPHSITVSVPAISGANLGEQTVQYAITTSTSATMPSNLVWQDSPTFTGLRALTTYRVWARTSASFNYNAGTARSSAAIQTGGITLNRTTLQTFAARTFTNNARSPLSVTITNKGNQPIGPLTIALSGAQADSFTTSVTTIDSIAGGKTATFTVVPKTGIGVRTHNATVTVSGADGATFSAKFNVRIVVSRGTGSAVNAAPAMESRTHNSITVKTVTPSGANPGGQALQYAITTSTATKMPTNLKWQASPTFTGLLRSTKYYVWARTAQNSNCSAGTARRSAVITTLAPANAVTLSRVGTYTFAAAGFNYGARSALSVKVTNAGTNATGVLTINLSGADPGSFEIVSPAGTAPARTLASIAKGGNRSFTIRPKQGLDIGTYNAIVTVSGANGISGSFNVSFKVNKAAGAATSNVPVASKVTAESITVSPVTVPTNPGKQEVKYAISRSSSTTALATLDWQTGTEFDGLLPATTYYVLTRTEENATHNAGAVRRSAAIKTDALSHSISLNRTGTQIFAAAAYGYGTRPSLLVTVSNTGKQSTGDLEITFSGPGFEVISPAAPELLDIAVGGNRSFTIRPVTGLPAGTYIATVTVSGKDGEDVPFSASFDVSFTVNRAAGAVLGGVPVITARTHSSITVGELTIPTNPGDQKVEYAIGTSTATPAAGEWKLIPEGATTYTFTGLDPLTVYYVFARSAQGDNNNAGAVQRTTTFTTAAP